MPWEIPTIERKWINANFRIRLYIDKNHTLIGAGSLNKHLDPCVYSDLFAALTRCKSNKYTYWNRKSLKIVFLAK